MAEMIRAGMIGMDTSHCGAFTKLFHETHADMGVRVVAAYPSFSPDLESSRSRVEEYTKALSEKYKVKMTKSIEEMLGQVDVVLIESVDGRRHLKELQAVVESGKPTFIDKPFAASLADAREMVKLIKQHKLPCFGGSSLRFDSAYQGFLAEREQKYGKVLGVDVRCPAHLEPTNPGLFWYGVHGVEILYTLMGRGCKTVSCTKTADGEVSVGIWKDARLGTMRGLRTGKEGYGATILSEKAPLVTIEPKNDFYAGLIKAMVEFFKTKKAPVDIDETLEICAFIDAALKSTKETADDIKLEG